LPTDLNLVASPYEYAGVTCGNGNWRGGDHRGRYDSWRRVIGSY
jgi:hypothetical protein